MFSTVHVRASFEDVTAYWNHYSELTMADQDESTPCTRKWILVNFIVILIGLNKPFHVIYLSYTDSLFSFISDLYDCWIFTSLSIVWACSKHVFYILHIVKIHLPIRGPAEMMSNYSQNLNRAFCHWTLYLEDSYVLIFVKICIHYILIIFFVLSQILSDPFNLLTHLDMGPAMECWWYTRWSLINENWFPFTQQISIANSFLVRGGNF